MTTREQAIRDEAERSIYPHEYDDDLFLSTYTSANNWPCERDKAINKAEALLTQHIAMTEAAERVRAATEPPASAEPSRLAFRDAEVARLNRVIAEANQQEIALTRMVANQKSTIRELRGKQEDVDEPGVLAVARDYYAGFAKAKAAKTQDTPEEAQHGYCGDEEQRPSGVEPKLNPCREVTQEEWRSLASTWLSCRESATLVVRARVAEAMEGTVPTTRYEDVVRRLAKISHGFANAVAVSPNGLHHNLYDRLCAKHGVKPEGGDK